MGELLSHSELELLLSAREPTPTRAQELPQFEGPLGDASSWKLHDFRELEPLAGEVIELVQCLQSGLCQQLERRFGSLFRTNIKVRPVGLDQMEFGELVSGPPHLIICRISSPSQPNPWLISWQPALANSLIERLLGGESHQSTNEPTEAPTEIEVHLLTRLCNAVLGEFDQSTSLNRLGHPRSMAIVADLMLVQSELAGIPFLCVSFEIVCDHDRGLMYCWLPVNSVVQNRQTKQFGDHRGQSPQLDLPTGALLETPVRRASIELIAELANLRLRVSEVAGLVIGDVLLTDLTQLNGATLRLANRTLYRVAIGALTGRKAVRLSKLLADHAVSDSTNELPQIQRITPTP